MREQTFVKVRKTLATLLVFVFLISETATAVSSTTDINSDTVSVIDTATNNAIPQ